MMVSPTSNLCREPASTPVHIGNEVTVTRSSVGSTLNSPARRLHNDGDSVFADAEAHYEKLPLP